VNYTIDLNAGMWYHISGIYNTSYLGIHINSANHNYRSVESPYHITNSSGKNTAAFYYNGDLEIASKCIAMADCTTPSDDAFVIANGLGTTVAYINKSGVLCVEDANCNDNDNSCSNPGDGSFIIMDGSTIVSYINSTGDLCLRGNLYEHGNP
jgi:hypothetical protein